MKTKTLTGVILRETAKAVHIDIGHKAARQVWVPKSVIRKHDHDPIYPETSILSVPAWFPVKPSSEQFNEQRYDRF